MRRGVVNHDGVDARIDSEVVLVRKGQAALSQVGHEQVGGEEKRRGVTGREGRVGASLLTRVLPVWIRGEFPVYKCLRYSFPA